MWRQEPVGPNIAVKTAIDSLAGHLEILPLGGGEG